MHPAPLPNWPEFVARFRSRRLLVIGDVMLDSYLFGRVERLNPEAPVPILQALGEKRSTGGAGNTAKNAASLGAATTLIGVVGNDAAAAAVQAAAEAEGYRALLVSDASRPSTEKRRYIVGSQQMLRVDHESSQPIGGEVEREVISSIVKAAADADAIIVSDYAKGLITPGVAEAIMTAAATHTLPIMADVKPSNITLFRGATYISPNRKEAHEYLGLNQHLQGGRPREELAERLHRTFGTGVFLTLSEDGMYVLTPGTPGVHVPQTHRIDVADTSGCGDTAAVTLMLAKICGADDVQAARLANAAGAVIATKIGAVALSPEDLVAMIAEGSPHPHWNSRPPIGAA